MNNHFCRLLFTATIGLCFILSTNALALPLEYVGPEDGDWYHPGNWSPTLIPGTDHIITIKDGRSAVADSAITSMPAAAQELHVGLDGTSGTLTVNGVDTLAVHRMTLGGIMRNDFSPNPTEGFGSFVNSEVVVVVPNTLINENAPAEIFQGFGVAVNGGEGHSHASVYLTSSTLISTDSTDRLAIRVGYILGDNDGSVASADGTLEYHGLIYPDDVMVGSQIQVGIVDTDSNALGASDLTTDAALIAADGLIFSYYQMDTGVSNLLNDGDTSSVDTQVQLDRIYLDADWALGNTYSVAPNTSGTLNVNAAVRDGTVQGEVFFEEGGIAAEENSIAYTNIAATFDNVEFIPYDDDDDINALDYAGAYYGGTMIGTQNIMFRDSSIETENLDFVDVYSEETGSNSTTDVTISFYNTPILATGEANVIDSVDAGNDGHTHSTGSFLFENSSLTVGEDMNIASNLDSGGHGTPSVVANTDVSFTSGTVLNTNSLLVSADPIEAEDSASIEVDTNLDVIDSEVHLSTALFVARGLSNDSAVVDIEAAVNMIDSYLNVNGSAEIGALSGSSAEPGNTVSGALRMTHSYSRIDGVLSTAVDRGNASLVVDASLLEVGGNLIMGPNTSTKLSLGGTVAISTHNWTRGGGLYPVIDVDQSIILTGDLKVDYIDGFTPQVGDKFEVIRAGGGIAGTFSSVSFPDSQDWYIEYDSANGVVTIGICPGGTPDGCVFEGWTIE